MKSSLVEQINTVDSEDVADAIRLLRNRQGKRKLAEAYDDLRKSVETILEWPDEDIYNLDFERILDGMGRYIKDLPDPKRNMCFKVKPI